MAAAYTYSNRDYTVKPPAAAALRGSLFYHMWSCSFSAISAARSCLWARLYKRERQEV